VPHNIAAGQFTYEVGVDEQLHKDPTVAARMVEAEMSDCEYGCKIYADPRSFVRVLAHNRAYGCDKTTIDVLCNTASPYPC
jgi:hypothetical protein